MIDVAYPLELTLMYGGFDQAGPTSISGKITLTVGGTTVVSEQEFLALTPGSVYRKDLSASSVVQGDTAYTNQWTATVQATANSGTNIKIKNLTISLVLKQKHVE